jgi:hypothetical protein
MAITLLGTANWRNHKRLFGIKPSDRRQHVYVIGKTGMGKTTLLENMIIQDIEQGRGVGVLDPHGDLAARLLRFVPRHRLNDVVYFNPQDVAWPFALNPFERVDADKRHLVAASLMSVFEKLFAESWGPRMAHILRNCILSLLEMPGSNLLGIPRLLCDAHYREKVMARVTDPKVRDFWKSEFATYQSGFRSEAIAPVMNKVGAFLSSPLVRNLVGQARAKASFREMMDEGKILIANLSKGAVGEENQVLLGSLLITKIQLAAMQRVDTPEENRRDFHLYCDEFQNFATLSFIDILSEARKYRLDLTLAHQFLGQLDHRLKDAVLGNVGTLIVFRIGASDAEELEGEFLPEISKDSFVRLPPHSVYLRLSIDAVSSRPFSADVLAPRELPRTSHHETIVRLSRERYCTPRAEVERKVERWFAAAGKEHPGKRTR